MVLFTIIFFTKVEVEEALDKVILTLKNFGAFRDAFSEFKGKLPTYFKEDKKPKTWDFQEHLIFKRFDRLKDISTPDFSTPSFYPRPFNPGLFNHELCRTFQPWTFQP